MAYQMFGYRKEIVRLKKEFIQVIRRKRTLTSVGLEIIHSSRACEPFVLFWTFDSTYVVGFLSYLGYKVETIPRILTLFS